MSRIFLGFVLASLLLPWPSAWGDTPPTPRLRLSEIVADPQHDWNGDGRVTASDEFVEIENLAAERVELAGWRLWLNDTTPLLWTLEGSLEPGGLRALVNPTGELNNNGHVALIDPAGQTRSEVRFGNWPGNEAGVPSANADGTLTEALRSKAGAWSIGHATPGHPNDKPRIEHAPPFDPLNGWWDPGNATRILEVQVVDADRTYDDVRLDVRLLDGTGNASLPLGPAGAPFAWNATWRTPTGDFVYEIVAVDQAGEPHRTPPIGVRVDATPPPTPAVLAPAWTNQSSLPVQVERVQDAGVGGVEYAAESAPGPHGPWVALGNWTPDTHVGTVDLESSEALWIRAVARDAYHHASNASAPQPIRLDVTPPDAPEFLNASGLERLRLTWSPAFDEGSGIESVRVERTAPTRRTWSLPPNATEVEDQDLRLGEEPSYRLWAVDRAGNVGAALDVRPDFEGLYPHAEPLRLSRPSWGPGTLAIHADFDRPMDPAQAPLLELRTGGPPHVLAGAWLSNRTTYAVRLPDSKAFPAGPSEILLAEAEDARGRALWRGQRVPLLIDHAPPTTQLEAPAAKWINASGVRLRAVDDLDPSPRIRYKAWSNASQPAPEGSLAAGSVDVRPEGETLILRFASEDEAGNRERETQRTFRVDRQPPRVESVRWVAAERVQLDLDDAASGIDPNRTQVSCEGRVLAWTPGAPADRILVDAPCPALRLRVRLGDHAGNSEAIDVALPSPPSRVAREEPAKTGREERPAGLDSAGEALGRTTRPPTSEPSPDRWILPSSGGGLGVVAALAWTARRRRHANPEPPSLARRLLAARAACP